MLMSRILIAILVLACFVSTGFSEPGQTPPVSDSELTVPQLLAKIKNEALGPILKAKPEDQNVMIRDNFIVALDKVDQLKTAGLSPQDQYAIFEFQLDIMTALEYRSVEGMGDRLDRLFEQIQSGGDESLLHLAEEKRLTREISKMKSLSVEEQGDLARKYCQFIIKQEAGINALGQAWTLSRMLYASPAHEAVAQAHDTLADHFSQFEEKQFQRAANDFRGMARRLRLPEQEFTFVGTTTEGETLNLADLRGKVVLVDFWDIYCKACIQEFPRVKQLYDEYHPLGLEVVGVSLDEDLELLKKVLGHHKLPWTTLQDSTLVKADGWLSPLREEFNINAVPVMILIGRDGKVISINARGEELERLLKEQFATSFKSEG